MKTKICTSSAVVRFQDSDPFNHLNNAQYLDYFMNAREDHLIYYYDLDPYKIAMTTGKGWVVASNQVAYFKPAMTMENILIESQLVGFKDQHLYVEARMYNADKTELKSFVWMHFVHYDLQGQKSVEHSREMQDLLSEVVAPIRERSFEERARTLKQYNGQQKLSVAS